MKKILSLALSVLLVFGALLSAFAAETETPAGPVVLDAIGQEMPEAFKGATHLVYNQYVDANADLDPAVTNGTAVTGHYSVNTAYDQSVNVYNGAKYKVPFSVEEAGTYTFIFRNYIVGNDVWDAQGRWPRNGTAQIDDGTVYDITGQACVDQGMTKFSGGCFFGPVEVYLTAGSHVLYLSGNHLNGAQPLFIDAYYYNPDNPPDTPVVPDTPVEPEVPTGPVVPSAIGQEEPDAFKGADYINFIDYVSENGDLTPPSGNTPGDYLTYTEYYGPSVGVFNGAKFAVPFEVETAGEYTFIFRMYIRADSIFNEDYRLPSGLTKYPHNGTIEIDGHVYELTGNKVIEAGMEQFSGGCWFGPVTVELEAGAHTMYLSGNLGNGANPYFMGAKFYQVGNEPDIPTDTPDTPVVPDEPDTPVEPEEPVSTTLTAVGASLPSEFEGARSLTFIDHVSENGDLEPAVFNDRGTLVSGHYTTYPNAYGSSVTVFSGAKFAVSFYAPYTGVYEFCIKNYIRGGDVWTMQPDGVTSKWPHPGTVQVDDGIIYTVTGQALIDAGIAKYDGGCCFTGMRVELTAGTHTLYLSGVEANGANPYFISAYYYCSERTDVYEELPETDFIVDDSYAIGSVPSTEEMYVPADGIYDVYALAQAGSEAGGFSVNLGETQYFIYEQEGLEAGESRYYEVAKGVALSAGDRISVGKITGVTPAVTEVLLLMTDYVGITEELPFPDAKATIQIKASANGADNESAGGSTWFNFGVNDSGSDQGGIRPQGTYSYKFNVEVPSDGTFSIAAYIDHLFTGDLNVKFYGKTYTIDPVDVSGMRYYVLDENVTLKAGTYTAEISRADENTAALFHSLILSADEIDGISEETPIGFENATVVHIQSQVDSEANVGGKSSKFYTWGSSEFAMDGYPALGKNAVWMVNTEFVYSVAFTPDEAGAYSFALYLANRTTTNGWGANSVLLPSPRAGVFALTLKDAAGTEIYTYTLNELAPKLGSRMYYTFGEDIALEAGVEYTLCIQMTTATDSALVDVLFELTSVVDAAKEAAKEEDAPTEGAVGGAYVGAIPMLPNMNETSESDALGQPQLEVINPVAAPAEVPEKAEKKDGAPDAPKQPYVPNPAPAAPNQPGSHPTIPARPAL